MMKGQLHTTENRWAIDGSVFENKKQLFLIWSGWKGDVNGEQDIYIAKMKIHGRYKESARSFLSLFMIGKRMAI